MGKFLSPINGKPPAAAEPKAVAERDAFAAKVAQFRRATGRLEACRVSYCCGKTRGAFEVIFERAGPSEQFVIAQINKIGASGGSSAESAAIPVRRTFDVSEVSFAGWNCPYCGDRSSVYCPCGQNNCCGRPMRQVGFAALYKCEPGCGRESETRPLENLTASQDGRRAAMINGVAARSQAALPKSNAPLLPRTRS